LPAGRSADSGTSSPLGGLDGRVLEHLGRALGRRGLLDHGRRLRLGGLLGDLSRLLTEPEHAVGQRQHPALDQVVRRPDVKTALLQQHLLDLAAVLLEVVENLLLRTHALFLHCRLHAAKLFKQRAYLWYASR